ncbi:MAG TPA: NAD(P)-dependent oxidoreductase [Opitutaceae bacterium]|nr:NAD(P)-dependent oxidoreductase [Opitutaceae bacterium]
MKIAIIGANGFIGSRLVEQFHLGGNDEVAPIVRKPSSLALPARFAVDWRLGDALDAASLTKALQGCDAVVHAAIGDPVQIEKMPAVLCAAASAAKIKRVVYLSSASVHGQNIPMNTVESTPLHTDHSLEYNNAKVRAERSFFSESAKYGLSGYALRPGVVYGPRSRWIADLANELRDGRAWLYENGSGICNSIYVDNLIHAVRLCLDAASGAGEAYLVGDAETVSWADFYHAAADFVGVDRSTIQSVNVLPAFEKSFKDRVEKTVAQPWVQSLLPAVPFKLKRATKNIIASWNPPTAPNAWTLPSSSAKPQITEEMALLQQNHWKFPHDKAAKVLGYAPPVSFAEAMRRSFAWLRFATEVN